ncbi:MAG: ATP-binding protein [Microcystis sp. M114S2]|jgi:Alw26I/Eco31I/Esp3I family type II restriction m6 adenine DNA methyltransferase|uniref:Eco57I restriction-modification methylase domain-containing protein n=1 Tax=unclassified Microcystis TaxID=2643300 RepID=UPI00258F4A96|nr:MULTISPECIES: DNA methyltransferase [unclassified Microcystis]MCA2668656.1 ATP-binding protein [Microcystis sp. M045S2]MCA2712407.1 ATP-binding protein [Microcystis sp. M172S2]MCA2806730.1 ATP-binding protein [Microcystis sp. M114S2]MCA2834591.1 ATP-binding protein [Microcystis sp. M007S1]MCA2839651.1 ATP-binding protein [Microcystis sp. M078S1]
MSLNFSRTRDLLSNFQFGELFIEELGWSHPRAKKAVSITVDNQEYPCQRIAEVSGVAVLEVTTTDIPDAKLRRDIHQQVIERIAENLLIFVDGGRTRSLWYWVKREGSKSYIRDHLYIKGQPGDLFLSKLAELVLDITDFEDGEPSVVEVAHRLQKGFDIEKITKKFYQEFQREHLQFLPFIQGIDRESDQKWYTSVILNRLMFVYFLQRKGFIDNDFNYLQNQLQASQRRGENLFYRQFLQTLFFQAFAKPEYQRDETVTALVGKVKYLNGGLFLQHPLENLYQNICIDDQAFENILDLFSRYSWNLDDTPGGSDDEINPDVLGYIFEKYINQKAFGAYYTRPEITEYLCDRTINKWIVERSNQHYPRKQFASISELLINLDSPLCQLLIEDILPQLSILDPACGSGAFLVAAMKTLIGIYSAVIGTIELRGDSKLKQWLTEVRKSHPSLGYYIKKRIISDNLYGVDIMEEATEIAKLRLFLALVAAAQSVTELEPLPNIDFNIMSGNSLIGLIRVDGKSFNLMQTLTAQNYQAILAEKNRSIELYKEHAFRLGEVEGTPQENRLQMLRDHIEDVNRESVQKLNQILLDEFSGKLSIKYESAQLTGKAKKRLLTLSDMQSLKPFHWGYHFDKLITEKGGFDVIITNPPWEVFKPQAKEFFSQHSDLVTKNKMDIKTFEKEQKKLLTNPEIAQAWLEYQSQYPHVSLYFRSSEQYKNQISIVNGKKQGTDINLYKLFVEQCFNLLHPQGYCGIIIPSGIYTDLGSKQLREMLFSHCQLGTLFGLSNERFIFEGVDHRFKFCLFDFAKGKNTEVFNAVFRINPREAISKDKLEIFLYNKDEQVQIYTNLIRKLSPDSLSVMEFKQDIDIHIAEKMSRFPLLGETLPDTWNLKLTSEFHMTNDSHLFKTEPAQGRLPLYEGKMIHQFTHQYALPKYWLDEKEARQALLKRGEVDKGQILDYQTYRLGFRSVSSSTNERSLISSLIPKSVFCGNSLSISEYEQNNFRENEAFKFFILTILNSFLIDWMLRQKVSQNLNFFYIYQLPIPRLKEGDKYFQEIVENAAKLICTTEEFEQLAKEVGIGSHKNGVTEEAERMAIRAKLDAIVAHLYELTLTEFQHILSTFPLVPESVKTATLKAYQTLLQ